MSKDSLLQAGLESGNFRKLAQPPDFSSCLEKFVSVAKRVKKRGFR
jgi:hypothetical protein